MQSFWRARKIDEVTSDDDKIAPVYRLDEICQDLQASPGDTVKEVVDYIMQRVNHASPFVKQKALRLIKYTVSRAGTEFRRSIQRHSAAIKGMVHYRGQPDPLRGDAPNKAVREMAQEAVQAIFNPQNDVKPGAGSMGGGGVSGGGASTGGGYSGGYGGGGGMEGGRRRMEGFGSTPVRENGGPGGGGGGGRGGGGGGAGGIGAVLGVSSESIRQGISKLTGVVVPGGGGPGGRAGQFEEAAGGGSYVGPRLDSVGGGDAYGYGDGGYGDASSYNQQRYSPHASSSSASSGGSKSKYVGFDRQGRTFDSSTNSYSPAAAPAASYSGSGRDREYGSDHGYRAGGAEEERVVEGMTGAGGVRLQPTREALRGFIASLGKLNAGAVAQALEARLASNLWQTRLKAMCVVEAVLRQEGDAQCDAIFDHFVDSPHALHDNVDSPQTSLRDKAKRVLDLLGLRHQQGGQASPQPAAAAVDVPDLIDVGEDEAQGADGGGGAGGDLGAIASDGSSVSHVSGGLGVGVSPVASTGVDDLLGGGDDLLSSLHSATPPPPPPAAAAVAPSAPAPTTAAAAVAVDPFAALSGDLTGQASDLFQGMSLNSQGPDANHQQGPAPTAAAGGANGAGAGAGGGGGGGEDLFAGMSVNQQQSQPLSAGSVKPKPAASPSVLLQQQQQQQAGQQWGIGAVGMLGVPMTMPAPLAPGPAVAGGGVGGMNMGMGMGMGMGAGPGMHPMMVPVPMMVPPGGVMMPGAPGMMPMGMGMNMGMGMGMGMGVNMGMGGGMGMGMGGVGGPGMMGGVGGMMGAANGGRMGGGGRAGSDFDFSGDPTVRPTPPSASSKEDSHAFDFVSEHIVAAMGTKKGPPAASAMRSS
ncbi:hypothetical protein CLOP_g8812 [Closterium sp. NIES-67]|nr:hypothetical protein CLOP_g8812 [Closterium sp. NIES-67]